MVMCTDIAWVNMFVRSDIKFQVVLRMNAFLYQPGYDKISCIWMMSDVMYNKNLEIDIYYLIPNILCRVQDDHQYFRFILLKKYREFLKLPGDINYQDKWQCHLSIILTRLVHSYLIKKILVRLASMISIFNMGQICVNGFIEYIFTSNILLKLVPGNLDGIPFRVTFCK